MTWAADRGSLPPAAKVLGWAGTVLFWAVVLALLFVAGVPVSDALLAAVLFVAVPTLAAIQLPLVEGARVERLSAYWGSIAALWLLGSAAWLVGTRGDGPGALRLVGLPFASLALWSFGLIAGGLLLILLFRQLAEWFGAGESPMLRELLPRTKREKGVFALLSLAAGMGEEMAYRGYAIPFLTPLLGAAGAVVFTSLVFGALHAYQGLLGIVRTALLGAMLALGLLASGSLWPAIVAHTAIDLLAGIVLGERLLSPALPTGVVGPPRAPDTER